MRVGQQVERELGLGADRVEARRVEDHQALLQQRVRKIDDRVPPARDVDGAVVAALGARGCRRRVVVQAVACARASTGTRFTCDTRCSASPMLLGRREVERQRHPLVGVALEFGDARRSFSRVSIGSRRIDGGRAGVVEELGRAHRRAPGRGGQQPLAEIGEEDRVDQLGLAAREFGDERDDQLVVRAAARSSVLQLEIDRASARSCSTSQSWSAAMLADSRRRQSP